VALLFVTWDGRWRIESTRAGNAFTVVERHPDGHVQTRLANVSLAEAGVFLAERGVEPDELRPA